RSQINPHFLFNTLNSIGELVHESADLAEKAVEKLAFIFRYTLRMSNQNFISLSDEMSLVSTYLDLEKIRFGDRLDIHIRMDHDVKDVQMPGFILQTLVENCIKHGIAKILHNGRVSVEAFREDDFLICEVFDNGPGIDLTRIYKSTGLSNSIARVENIYGVKNLLYFENTGNGTLVRLKIPLAGTIRAQQA
ncbi:MAG: histidine kinase, partial [Bacteroidetes bacterium]